MTYYGEYGQDRWLVRNVFDGICGGTFVEAGALDGLFHSNTLHFERELGWRGVLVEPIPELFEQLSRNRPLARSFGCALGPCEGFEEFEISPQTPGWSGYARLAHSRRAGTVGRRRVTVPVRPLVNVLREAELAAVDYLSLDVEGAELEVLEPYPFDEVPVRVIGVEDNDGTNEPLRALLLSRGYRHLARVGVDEFWTRG